MDVLSSMEREAFWSGEADENPLLLRGALTIHDHWLSEIEAKTHWMSIANFSGNESGEAWSEFRAKETAFVSLFESLKKECGLEIWELGQRFEPYRRSRNDLGTACSENVRERRTDLFRAEKCGFVILGGFDLTFPVYCESEEAWLTLNKSAASFGLYLLPMSA